MPGVEKITIDLFSEEHRNDLADILQLRVYDIVKQALRKRFYRFNGKIYKPIGAAILYYEGVEIADVSIIRLKSSRKVKEYILAEKSLDYIARMIANTYRARSILVVDIVWDASESAYIFAIEK